MNDESASLLLVGVEVVEENCVSDLVDLEVLEVVPILAVLSLELQKCEFLLGITFLVVRENKNTMIPLLFGERLGSASFVGA